MLQPTTAIPSGTCESTRNVALENMRRAQQTSQAGSSNRPKLITKLQDLSTQDNWTYLRKLMFKKSGSFWNMVRCEAIERT